MSKRRLLAEHDGLELTEWFVYWSRIAPFGDEWRQTTRLESALINFRAFRSADAKIFTADELMPVYRKPEPEKPKIEQPAEDQQHLAKIVHKALGG